MYNCVIFDVDGTLIDTEKAVLLSLQKVIKEELGSEYSKDELTFALGIPGTVSLSKLGVKNIESANEKWNKYMKNYYHYINVFTDIEVVLQKLNNVGIKTGIVTSKTKEELRDDFSPFGLNGYLQYVVCADDTTKHKPEPEPILRFLNIADVEPSKAIYIGDTIYDMKSANGAGVDFALALWGARNVQGLNSKYKIAQPKDILNLVI